MSELRLVGLDDDAERVVLEGPDGQRFVLPIDEALRAAVRRDRPQLEQVRVHASGTLPPREMQARIRAGATAQEVADAAGVAVEIVERYEGPVLAERDFVARQARETRIGHDLGSPVLGDLVADRLATRGVVPGTVRWDAYRDVSGPWSVVLAFEVSGVNRSARWVFDLSGRTLRAMDDEARWLSETELPDEPIPRRHLAAVRKSDSDTDVGVAVRPVLAAVDRTPNEPDDEPEDDPFGPTDALLADLSDRRGVRQPLDEDDDEDLEEFEGFGPQHAFDFDHPSLSEPPGAHPAASRPEEATDATVLELGRRPALVPDPADDEPGAEPTPEPRPKSRKGRASVPSWDEIVFGAKPE